MCRQTDSGVSQLFASGKLYLIRRPVSGRVGIIRLWDMLCTGELGVDFNPVAKDEVWVLMVNRSRNRLRILHVDQFGYELIVRINYDGRFDVVFHENGPEKITRIQLRRLVLDGTVEGEWRSIYIKNVLSECSL